MIERQETGADPVAPGCNRSTNANQRQEQQDMSTSERLMRYGKQMHNKHIQQRQQRDASLDAQFDFQPKINQRSKSIANQKAVASNPNHSFNQVQYLDKSSLQIGAAVDGAANRSQILQGDNAISFLNHSTLYNANQTQMPGGDEDDILDDDEEEAFQQSRKLTKLNVSLPNNKRNALNYSYVSRDAPLPNEDKFFALYDDAKHRNLRQEHIYAKCYDQECTFKPKLITQQSKVSQNTIRQVQQEVLNKSKILGESVHLDYSQRTRSQENKHKTEKPAVGGVPP